MNREDPASERIAIARIIKERGITGEIKALPLSGAAQSLSPLTDVQILTQPGNIRETRKVRSVRHDRGFLLISFYGISNREEAATLRNAVIETDVATLPALPEDEYYHGQIMGLTVITDDGRQLGTIADIMETGGADVYVVHGHGREYLIPAIKDIIAQVDLDAGTVTIKPMEGLLD